MKLHSLSLHELEVWCRWGCLHERISDLCRPVNLAWPGDPDEFDERYPAVERELPKEHWHLLGQAYLARALARRDEAPTWFADRIRRHIDLQTLGIPLGWDQLLAAHWDFVALPVVGRSGRMLRWGMVGIAPSTAGPTHPDWWPDVTDDAAQDALSAAATLFEEETGRRLFFWPFLPRIDSLSLYGPSLALPVYLCAWGIQRNLHRSRLLATGGIDDRGRLFPVGDIKQKAAIARRSGYQALLFPASAESPERPPKNIELIPVEDVKSARYFWELYTPEARRRLEEDLAALRDPRRLAVSVHLLKGKTLRWQDFGVIYGECIEEIMKDPELAESFVGGLERMMEKPEIPFEHLQVLLEPVTQNTVRGLAEESPMAAFRMAQLRLAACTRQGDVEAADVWNTLSGNLRDSVSSYHEGLQNVADFWNRWFVHDRHGRYDFRPDLPETVQVILSLLERQREIGALCGRPPIVPALGKLYGTIAQNYGFCGPTFLEDTETAARKAQAAFHDGEVKEYRNDWRRSFCYLAYAYLDAGRAADARNAVEAYIGRPLSENSLQPESCHPYEHALIARFFADTGSAFGNYVAWCRRRLRERLGGHPWQLWLLNAGRLIEDAADRTLAWRLGLELCLKLGDTARPMGLLHLAELQQAKLADDDFLARRTEEILERMRDAPICTEHFSKIFSCLSWKEVLAAVYENRAHLFPFSYR